MTHREAKSPTWNAATNPDLDPPSAQPLKKKKTQSENLRRRIPTFHEETASLTYQKKPTMSEHLSRAFEAQVAQKSRRKYLILFIFLYFIFSIFRVVIFSLGFATYVKEGTYDFISAQNAVLEGAYCSSTYVITSINADCSSGSRVHFDTFAGTKAGCICPSTGDITAGDCSSSDCNGINALPTAYMSSWRKITLCAVFANYKRNSTCETGYTQCGRNSFYCVAGTSCGISDLTLTVTGAAAPSVSYSTVTVNATVKVYYLVDPVNDNQLSSFSINHGYPCVSKDMYGTRVGYPENHPLEVTERKGCRVYGIDYENKILDSYYENIVYDDNSISYSSVPGFSKYLSSQPVNLVANFLPKLNGDATFEKCGNTDKVCTFVTNMVALKKTFDPANVGLFYFEVFATFILIIHAILGLRLEIYPLKGIRMRYTCLLITFIVSTVYLGLTAGFLVDMYNQFRVNGSSFRSDFQKMATTRCYVNESVNDAFQAFENFVSTMERQNLFMIGAWVSTMIQGVAAYVAHRLLLNVEAKVAPVSR